MTARSYWECFIPLFVAVDAIGTLPIYMGLTESVEPSRLRRVVAQSVMTASIVAISFCFGGKAVLRLLGITVPDFMIAGGLLLLVISIGDLLSGEKLQRKLDMETVGAVPIGVPLITGPAVLTTCLLLLSQHGMAMTVAAVISNIFLAGMIFLFAVPISRFLGNAGTKTLSKIAILFLAAIAVMMIRKGIFLLLASEVL